MKNKRNWIIGIALSATAAFVALQTVNAPTQESDSIVVTETATLAYEGCAFSWAYQDEPELTKTLDTTIKEINPNASATATVFGEDCIRADGSSTFGAMETDFKVHLLVDDLTQHEAFGNFVKQVMQIVIEIPREELSGPKDGFVEFWFEKNGNEKITFRVPIQTYINEAKEKSGTELFEYFYQP